MTVVKKIVVKSPGATTDYSNAEAHENPTGSLSITVQGRNKRRITYASGRWTSVTEEGVTNG